MVKIWGKFKKIKSFLFQILLHNFIEFIMIFQFLKGPERASGDAISTDLNYGCAAMTDAVFYPSQADDIPKVSEQKSIEILKK